MANRLASATSPYLLQHAENPVDWWEWGPEAFAEAKRRDTPILLSVGYAACHWCHVDVKKIGKIPDGGGWRAGVSAQGGKKSAKQKARIGYD